MTFKTQGYLKIFTINRRFKHLFKLYNDQELYAIRGIYISPFAKSILENDDVIDGLIFDGTFKILRNYVTCIILVIIHNTGIPVGFSFSHIEDKNFLIFNKKLFYSLIYIIIIFQWFTKM